MFEWRSVLRKSLLRLLKWTRRKPQKTSVWRNESFLYHKLRMPVWSVGVLTFFVLYWILFLELGLNWRNAFGVLIFISLMIFWTRFYLRRCSPEILSDNNRIALLSTIVGILILIMIMVVELTEIIPEISPYIVPVPAAAMLVTILLGGSSAIIVVLFLSIILSALNNFDFNYLFVSLVGGMAGIGSVLRMRNRKDLMRAGLFINITNILSMLILGLLQNVFPLQIGKNFLWGIGNGFLSVILTTGILPYLESAFSIATNIKLLELADFNQPVLKRLMLEAPGTYHHSLLVGNLVETAAELIGANSLLARVGAYYHDIGKLPKAEYFIENVRSKSKHDTLAPPMSSLILVSHVKDGVALAKEHNLDKVIIDIIEQHHGTCLIHFFYQRALEEYKAEKVEEGTYRYPGPKPRTREAALVMLADAVEAASRTLEEPTHRKIREIVNKIINNKFIDGQLNDCDITLANLHRIAESFIHSLVSIYHPRIEYPDYEKEQKSKENENFSP